MCLCLCVCVYKYRACVVYVECSLRTRRVVSIFDLNFRPSELVHTIEKIGKLVYSLYILC